MTDKDLSQKDQATQPQHLVLQHIEWRTPLPPPQVLQEYQRISPDTLNVLLRMVEKQSEANRDYLLQDQRNALLGRCKEENTRRLGLAIFALGRLLAFAIALAGFALCAYLAHKGYPKVAALLCGGELAVLVYGFLRARASSVQEGDALEELHDEDGDKH